MAPTLMRFISITTLYLIYALTPHTAFATCPPTMKYNTETHRCICPNDTINNRSLKNSNTHIGACYHPMNLVSLSDQVLWLDAHDLSTITWDSATLQVSAWNDKSANSNHATDLTSATTVDRPSLAFTSKNNKHSISFLTADHYLDGTIPQISGNQKVTMIVVKQQVDTTIDRTSLSLGATGENINVGTTTGTPNNFRTIESHGNVTQNTGSEDWHIHTTIRDNFNITLFIDGQQVNTAAKSVLNLTTDYTIGRSVEPADRDFFRGHIGEIIIFNTDISITDRTYIEQYLSKKWRIDLN